MKSDYLDGEYRQDMSVFSFMTECIDNVIEDRDTILSENRGKIYYV